MTLKALHEIPEERIPVIASDLVFENQRFAVYSNKKLPENRYIKEGAFFDDSSRWTIEEGARHVTIGQYEYIQVIERTGNGKVTLTVKGEENSPCLLKKLVNPKKKGACSIRDFFSRFKRSPQIA